MGTYLGWIALAHRYDAGATQVLDVDQGLKALFAISNPLRGIRAEYW